MSLTRLSSPSALPVSIAEAKAQCRVDSHDEDALLAAYVRSAMAWVEEQEGIVLITSTWAYRTPAFPSRYTL
jgi:uncharacterized phiE125 gp8 family phage protein